MSSTQHSHADGLCPVVGATHTWCPAQGTDSRSPCPALNTLANHGYLPRNGEQITAAMLVSVLREVYGLTTPLCEVLAHGGVFLLEQLGPFSLGDLARHNRIEHDASLVHADTAPGREYAPDTPDTGMLEELLDRSHDGKTFNLEDVAAARVAREAAVRTPLDAKHAEIARGEMALVVGIFSESADGKGGVPLDILRRWFWEERLPDDWKHTHTLGLLQTVRMSKQIRDKMQEMRKGQSEGE
ncbi:Cloroperoxidase [Artomyces pyxidatus]|uniref:Cloroperoxidase n=1 Tax=Artomyces pyxidatus TaxID=48021 RepID=A0ACB8TEV4_9AGAM|nr:Cloroperoxidase [Artomyces pyxidatus]